MAAVFSQYMTGSNRTLHIHDYCSFVFFFFWLQFTFTTFAMKKNIDIFAELINAKNETNYRSCFC